MRNKYTGKIKTENIFGGIYGQYYVMDVRGGNAVGRSIVNVTRGWETFTKIDENGKKIDRHTGNSVG